MEERKLASIQKIEALEPIQDADNIEKAVIKGWNVVVKKGEFSVGDLVVYCEIDSVMPERPEFEFLRSKKFRIKTIKLRGIFSQGICFPIDILKGRIENPLDMPLDTIISDRWIDQNLTEIIGVTKFEPPIPAELSGEVKGLFPSHSIKTDEERIQNLKAEYDGYKSKSWMVSEKLDGTSATFFVNEGQFGIASRNLELKENDTNTYWRVARELDIEGKMRAYIEESGLESLTIQGEIIGEGVQKNKYKLRGQTVRIFRVFNPKEFKFLTPDESIDAIKAMGLEFVPVLERNFQLPEKFEDLIEYSDGKSQLADTAREGLVFVEEGQVGPTGRNSFKVISNKFILKHDE